MILIRITTLTVVLAVISCRGPDNGDDSSTAEQIQLCQDVCLMPLCDPLVDPASQPSPTELCSDFCATAVAQANEQACSEQYLALLQCLDALSCDDFYLWYEEMPDSPCMLQEQTLTEACSGVEVPR